MSEITAGFDNMVDGADFQAQHIKNLIINNQLYESMSAHHSKLAMVFHRSHSAPAIDWSISAIHIRDEQKTFMIYILLYVLVCSLYK